MGASLFPPAPERPEPLSAPRISLALVFLALPCACASFTAAEKEFLRHHQRFIGQNLLEHYREHPEERGQIEETVRQLVEETTREEFRESILEGEVARGMTQTEAVYAWGPPARKSSASASGVTEEWWTYEREGETITLAFRNSFLIAIGPEGGGPMAVPELEGETE